MYKSSIQQATVDSSLSNEEPDTDADTRSSTPTAPLRKAAPLPRFLHHRRDWSDTTLLFARCLGMVIIIEEVKGAMIEVEVGVTVVVGAAVVAGEEMDGLMLEPLGYMCTAFPPGREAAIWKTSSQVWEGVQVA